MANALESIRKEVVQRNGREFNEQRDVPKKQQELKKNMDRHLEEYKTALELEWANSFWRCSIDTWLEFTGTISFIRKSAFIEPNDSDLMVETKTHH